MVASNCQAQGPLLIWITVALQLAHCVSTNSDEAETCDGGGTCASASGASLLALRSSRRTRLGAMSTQTGLLASRWESCIVDIVRLELDPCCDQIPSLGGDASAWQECKAMASAEVRKLNNRSLVTDMIGTNGSDGPLAILHLLDEAMPKEERLTELKNVAKKMAPEGSSSSLGMLAGFAVDQTLIYIQALHDEKKQNSMGHSIRSMVIGWARSSVDLGGLSEFVDFLLDGSKPMEEKVPEMQNMVYKRFVVNSTDSLETDLPCDKDLSLVTSPFADALVAALLDGLDLLDTSADPCKYVREVNTTAL